MRNLEEDGRVVESPVEVPPPPPSCSLSSLDGLPGKGAASPPPPNPLWGRGGGGRRGSHLREALEGPGGLPPEPRGGVPQRVQWVTGHADSRPEPDEGRPDAG